MTNVRKPVVHRQGTRQQKLEAARQRRLDLDRGERDREERIDAAVVDFEEAWLAREEAVAATGTAEAQAAEALQRLVEERVNVATAAQLTGVEPPILRRLRSVGSSGERLA
ncbi:hypothetical protein RDV89_17400 [Nocardioides zeae]|uniref:Uncharacterized protein n=1 Tax=Nocardioides imazamoxiresistens TaxID=3231893 RepID=A0ABU3Q026_9ACTN|nr:hypothetical protein [Nocardioides zeae]MDT9594868.1 hypothetical protein [Nocardioides zeae]